MGGYTTIIPQYPTKSKIKSIKRQKQAEKKTSREELVFFVYFFEFVQVSLIMSAQYSSIIFAGCRGNAAEFGGELLDQAGLGFHGFLQG